MRVAFHLNSTLEMRSVETHVNTRIQQLSKMFLYYVRLRQQNIYPPGKQILPISCGCICDMGWRDVCRGNIPLHELVFGDIQIMWCVGVCVFCRTYHSLLCDEPAKWQAVFEMRICDGKFISVSLWWLNVEAENVAVLLCNLFRMFKGSRKFNSNSKMLNPQAV